MSLQPKKDELGLWRDPDVLPSKCGAHVVIIGISNYPSLAGGTAQAPVTGGLGQLVVSATTGARLFKWLLQSQTFGGVPVASCRLLLSPAPNEKETITEIAGEHYSEATFAAIASALNAWSVDILAATEGPYANVLLLFFSGHGLERFGKQYLLAQDILDVKSPAGRTNAIEVDNLWHAFRGYGIEAGFLFLDSCRNDTSSARALGIEGKEVLTALVDPRPAPTSVPCLKATGSGEFAYQRAGDTATFFGQALLESLDGPPPQFVPYDITVEPWKLRLANLETHVRNRVREMFAVANSNAVMPIEAYGFPYRADALVAERHPIPTLQEQFRIGFGAKIDTLPRMDILATQANALGNIESRASAAFAQFKVRSRANFSVAGALADGPAMHDVLGHERLTGYWIDTLKITDARSGKPIKASSLRLAQAHQTESTEVLTAWMDVHVPAGAWGAIWIQVGYPGRKICAVLVPQEPTGGIPVRLDVSYVHKANEDNPWELRSLVARVGQPEGPEKTDWTSLWDAQRAEQVGDLGAAQEMARKYFLKSSGSKRKHVSTVASAVAAVMVLRSGDLTFANTLRGLPMNETGLPDFSFLQIESIRLGDDYASTLPAVDELNAMIAAYVIAVELGLPRIGSVMTMAARLAVMLEPFAKAHGGDMAGRFKRAAATIRKAWGYSHNDGLYTSFVTTDEFPPPLHKRDVTQPVSKTQGKAPLA